MTRALLAAALLAPLALFANEAGGDLFVKGNAEAGATKATPCVACHGVAGNGAISPDWPKLAGQHSAYVQSQLKQFKEGNRKNPVMGGQAALDRKSTRLNSSH